MDSSGITDGGPDPHTPEMINAAAPGGAPPRRIRTVEIII